MKLLFDLSSSKSIYEGVTVYSIRILKGFQKNQYKDITLLVNKDIYEYISNEFTEFKCIISDTDNTSNLISNGIKWIRQVGKIDCDIIFSPNVYLTYFSSKRIVQTIHDLQPLKVYKGKRLLVYRLLMPLILMRSYRIISITNYVKGEIENRYKYIDKNKIHTIYNGIITKESSNGKRLIEDRYLLYVSLLWKYKNILTLLKAFNRIKTKTDHKLVIIGRSYDRYWENECLPYIVENNLQNRVVCINLSVTDEELISYYKYADIFIHPSLMEGFGYTPIEAAIYKVPVITSTETALYESTMGLLNYYAPATNDKALADKIMELIINPMSEKELENISVQLKKKYDYIKQSEKIYNFLKESSKV